MTAVYTIWLRNVKRYIRSKSRIFGSLAQPLFFLLILGFGLNSILTIPGTGHSYIKFLIPGVIGMTVLFTSIFSGIQVIWDKQFGFLKETLVAPISRYSIMIGQTLGGATTAFIQGLLILIISIFIGGLLSTSTILGFLIAIIFMALIGISFTALGIAIASKMEDMHGFQLIINFVIFPIFFLSGALFPLENAPTILKTISMFNPLSYGIEGIRYGLLGSSPVNPLVSLSVMLVFSAIVIAIGSLLFKRIKI